MGCGLVQGKHVLWHFPTYCIQWFHFRRVCSPFAMWLQQNCSHLRLVLRCVCLYWSIHAAPCSPVQVHMDIKLRRRFGKVLGGGYRLGTELSVTCGSGVARLCCLNSRDKQKQIIKVIPLRGQLKDHLRQTFGDSRGPHYALGEEGRHLRADTECVLAPCFA